MVYEVVRSDHQVESHAAVKVISIPQNESEIDSLRMEGMSADEARTYFQEIVNDFANEIQLMESFKGTQNIVSIEDYKVIEKKDGIGWDIYIRMELLTSLYSYICDKTLTEKEVIKLGCDICTALELCARKNVIHRDIKPENIFINSFGDFKLGDFGIARRLDNVTGSLSRKGTYDYMAPEVELGVQYDATVDLYSLGLVLYRLMNKNRLPFLDREKQLLNPNERVSANKQRLNGEQLPAPSDASPALADIILCACSHDPDKRFVSATAMKKALMSLDGKLQNNAADFQNNNVSVNNAPKQAGEQSNFAEKAFQTPEKNKQNPDTFGEKKISKLPKILATVVVLGLIAGIAVFAVPKLIGVENSENVETFADTDSTANQGIENNTDSKEDKEQISLIIEEAESLAGREDYKGALAKITAGLQIYSDSKELLEKSQEYSAAENEQMKKKALEEAASLAEAGNYVSAMDVLKKALDTYGGDTDCQAAYDQYQQENIAKIKSDALTAADNLAQQGDYLGALTEIRQASTFTGEDAVLHSMADTYEDAYVSGIFSQADAYLAENNITAAKTILQNAAAELPDNEAVKTRLAEVNKYKTVLLDTLSPINGGFTWNEGEPGDPFGTSYSDAQNYSIFHGYHDNLVIQSGHKVNANYTAEYKIGKNYNCLSFTISPYSDFGKDSKSYVQVFVNDTLRYTSPRIGQKSQPFQTPLIDLSDAEYLMIKVHADSWGCLMLSDVLVMNSPTFESSQAEHITSLSLLDTFNGSLPWHNGYPADTMESDYSMAQNYAVLSAGRWDHSLNQKYSAEYYIASKYHSISLSIAPAECFGESGSAQINIYANDTLVYTSENLTQKTIKYNTGEIDLTGVDYVKITADINPKCCIIISDVLLTDAG